MMFNATFNNVMILLHVDFRTSLVISPWVAVLVFEGILTTQWTSQSSLVSLWRRCWRRFLCEKLTTDKSDGDRPVRF
jgi:hypothetical protein